MFRGISISLSLAVITFILSFYQLVFAFKPLDFQDNINNKNNQLVRSGKISSIEINRGPASFTFSDGELTLFDFGSNMPCGLVFEGDIDFRYTPPNEMERYQLNRLYGKDKIEMKLERVAMFYTIELDGLPDMADLKREQVSGDAWRAMHKAYEYAFDYLGEYIPCKLLNDILSEQPGTYFLADIWESRYDHLIFIEDHRFDDIYRLYQPRIAGGIKTFDVLGGYSPGDFSPSERGIIPIDVSHYEIKSTINRGGDMTVDCRIHFTPNYSGSKFLDWQWYEKNEPLAAFDSDGDSLDIIHRDKQWGLGMVLNKPTVGGNNDYIDIEFECNAIRKFFGIYVLEGQTFWYPLTQPFDRATYDLSYECQRDYEVVSCGRKIDSEISGDKYISQWLVEIPVKYVSFNLGVFKEKKFAEYDSAEGIPPVIVYQGKSYRHDEDPQMYAARYDNLSSADMLEAVGKDVSGSLKLFTDYFGPCQFDTVRVSEIPWGHGQGSPGLLHLSWYTFQFDDLIGSEERFRAHEVSHQWWGHIVENEHYRDTWILEGMAELCGLMYLEDIAESRDVIDAVLENWKREVILGGEVRTLSTDKLMVGVENYLTVVSDGSVAGPVVMSSRLDNSLAHDYQVITYTKGAYILYMIRYMMRDYENQSDAAFLAMLRDMLKRFDGRSIDTEAFKELVEEHIGMDMDWFFDQYVYGIEIPAYEFGWDTEATNEKGYKVVCEIKQDDVPDNFKMKIPVAIYSDGNKIEDIYSFWVDGDKKSYSTPVLNYKPKSVKFNYNDAVLCRVR